MITYSLFQLYSLQCSQVWLHDRIAQGALGAYRCSNPTQILSIIASTGGTQHYYVFKVCQRGAECAAQN